MKVNNLILSYCLFKCLISNLIKCNNSNQGKLHVSLVPSTSRYVNVIYNVFQNRKRSIQQNAEIENYHISIFEKENINKTTNLGNMRFLPLFCLLFFCFGFSFCFNLIFVSLKEKYNHWGSRIARNLMKKRSSIS